MGTMDAMVGLLAVWTTISVLFVGAWHAHVGRRGVRFAIAEPPSHVRVIAEPLAPIIDLAQVRAARMSTSASVASHIGK